MKIIYRQTGGFAGLTRGTEIDTDNLPTSESEEVISLTRAANLSLSQATDAGQARDTTQHAITIDDGGAEITTTFDERAIPGTALPLVAYLKARSQPRKPT